MKKTRKFVSIFAILFAIVLALSVCFFAACGNKEEDETTTPEVQDDESKNDDTKEDDTTVTPNPDPEPDPDPDPDPTPADTKVIDVATPDEAGNTTAGDAVFKNNEDVAIEVGEDGTYVVSGTASIMTAADAAWWYADETAEGGDPYVVIKILAAEGETITLNTGKTYTNEGEGDTDFVDGYLYTVYLLAFGETTGVCTSKATYTITAAGDTEGTEYTVSFAGMVLPKEEIETGAEQTSMYFNFSTIDMSAIENAYDGDSGKTATSTTFYFSETECVLAGDGVNADDYILTFLSHTDKTTTETTGLPTESGYTKGLQLDGAAQSTSQRVLTLDLSGFDTDNYTVTIQVIATCDARSSKLSQLVITQDTSSTSDMINTSKALAYSSAITDEEKGLADGENTTATNQYAYRPVEYVVGSGTDSTSSLYYITCTQTVRIYAVNILVTEKVA